MSSNKILDIKMKLNNQNKVGLLCAGLLFASSFFVGCDSEKSENSGSENAVTELNVSLDMNLQTMESFGASDAWQCNFIGKNPLALSVHKRTCDKTILPTQEVNYVHPMNIQLQTHSQQQPSQAPSQAPSQQKLTKILTKTIVTPPLSK